MNNKLINELLRLNKTHFYVWENVTLIYYVWEVWRMTSGFNILMRENYPLLFEFIWSGSLTCLGVEIPFKPISKSILFLPLSIPVFCLTFILWQQMDCNRILETRNYSGWTKEMAIIFASPCFIFPYFLSRVPALSFPFLEAD